jgi:hypothetical protein
MFILPLLEERSKVELWQILAAKDQTIQLEEVEFVSSEPKMWPSSALGCPKKGGYYLPVLTPGFDLKFRVRGIEYAVHTDQTGNQIAIP